MQREHLEQRPHLAWIGKPRRARKDRFPLLGRGIAAETIQARLEPELEQELPLRHGAERGEPGPARRLVQSGEIDMGGEVGLAWCRQRIGEAMTAHGLKRIADAAPRRP